MKLVGSLVWGHSDLFTIKAGQNAFERTQLIVKPELLHNTSDPEV